MKNNIWPRLLLILLICLAMTACGKKETDVFTSTETVTAESETFTETSMGTSTETSTEGLSEEGTASAGGSDTLVIDGTEVEITSVFVYICGAVEKPDVYELPSGSRICDAFLAAGGLTESAASDYWNQAELLTDGEMIYVPTEDEAAQRQQTDGQTDGSGSWKSSAASTDAQEADDGKININTATKEELMTISGIGEGRAESIIKYREANGAFSKTEDITNVSGIGDALYDSMKDTIKTE